MTYRTYRYWALPELGRNACICAAIEVDKETLEAKFGFSFCSPNEKVYDKAKARQIADGRLEKNPIFLQLTKDEGISRQLSYKTFTDGLGVYIDVRGCAGDKGDVPRWAVREYDRASEIINMLREMAEREEDESCSCKDCLEDVVREDHLEAE